MASFRERFVQVQDRRGHHRPRGELVRRKQELRCSRSSRRSTSSSASRAAAGERRAERPDDAVVVRRLAERLRAPVRGPPRSRCGSFSVTSAWSGVLVRWRRTTHISRLGASKAASDGGGASRFQKV